MINSVCYFNKGNIGKPYGTLNDLVELFNTFNDGENAWLLCMQGNFVWRRPNADIILLNYDPFSGKKIDWDYIKSHRTAIWDRLNKNK